MKTVVKASIAGLVAFGAMGLTASASWACGVPLAPAPASFQDSLPGMATARAALLSAASAGDSSEVTLQKANFDIGNNPASIVGMWREQFFVGTQQIDFAFAQWHADGTEFMNSGTLNPEGQNYCLGVWQKTNALNYHLNHFAFAYAPGATTDVHTTPAATVNIKEDVSLDRQGNAFSGTFTIDSYDFVSNKLLQHVAGRVVGQRITAY